MQHHDEELFQFQGRLSYLTSLIEQMQWEVARLSRESKINNTRVTALTKHLIHSETQTRLDEKLAEFLSQLETSQEKLEDLSQTVKKLSRTQFKTNTLGESKEQQVTETIALLRDLVTKREESKEAQRLEEQQRIAELQAQSRGELAADFLPVLDGIELALEHQISVPVTERHPGEADTPPGFLRKIFRPAVHPPEDQPIQKGLQEMYNTMTGWLHGLEIVRERFVRLLEREGIERIPDVNAPFDPHLHVAVDTEERTDVAENTIVSVIRKGYTHHDRVLRYAEVIVAKPPEEEVDTTNDNKRKT